MTTLRFALCVLLLAPLAAAAQAGRVLIAVGEVSVERGGQRIPLARGSALEPGDTIRLGPASNAQIRMSDGAIVSLAERTVLRIDEHVWTGRVDGSERSFLSLLAGGMRTVAGAIGKLRRTDRYGVRTATASIGIRGTHYVLRECNELSPCEARGARAGLELAQAEVTASDAALLAQAVPAGGFAPPGTYGGVTDGRIGVTNEAADTEFGAREFFYVADRLTPPQGLIAPPPFLYDPLPGRIRTTGQTGAETGETIAQGGIEAESRPSEPPPAPRPPDFVVSEERSADGAPAVVPAAPTIAGVGALFDPLGFPGVDGHGGGFFTPSDLMLSGSGTSTILLGFTIPPGFGAEPGGGSFPISGAVTSPGHVINETHPNDIGAIWGRWTSGWLTDAHATTTVSLHNQFHYLSGPATPAEVIAAKTGTVSLSVAGHTTPTNNLGELGSVPIVAASLDFTARTFTPSNVTFSFPSQSWNFTGMAPTSIHIVPGKGAFINATGSGSCSGHCSSAATLGMTGIFMGPQGNHLGLGLNAVAGSAHASGAVLMKTQPE